MRTSGWFRSLHRSAGFTLIEMVVVVAIVGILATATRPLLELQNRRQKEFELRQGLRTIRTAIDAFRQAAADGRIAPPQNDSGCPPGLQWLVDGVGDARSPTARKIYFLRRLPRDPFADAELPAAQTWGLRSYDSPPDAPQAGSDVFDVHSNAAGSGLDGTPYRAW